jgi:DNA-binding beta-propeller fold protein YncE
MKISALMGLLACLLFAGLSVGAPGASAYRATLEQEGSPKEEEAWLRPAELTNLPEGQIEGACGIAVAPSSETLYVADYYHRAIDAFSLAGLFLDSQVLFGGDDAVCGLAVDATGNRYGNEFHQAVLTLPDEELVDPGPATGVAVDEAGNVYVDDRTYVAVYDAPVSPGDSPSEKIGLGNLEDAYGVAVDSKAGLVYVADAATDTVKVFKPAIDPEVPAREIGGPPGAKFNSLKDAAVAVDTSGGAGEGHMLVVDNLDPGGERPRAAIYEFDAASDYLDRLAGRVYGGLGVKTPGPMFGEPSGLAVDPETGDLYVTTGNSVNSNLLKYGPYEPFAPPLATPGDQESGASPDAPVAARSAAVAGAPRPAAQRGGSEAVIVRRGPVQVSFDGKLAPKRLPRHGSAPVGIAIDARISATGKGSPPQLRRISIAINRNGHFASTGLPACRVDQIQPSTTSGALAACGASLVGEGHFSADVKLPEQSPFPSEGKVLAFNGRVNGRPAILAHIYGTQPAPTSAVLPFLLRDGHGTYGTTLEASLPQATGSWGYVTGLKMNLRRRFSYRGKARSFLSAGCPAAPGFPSAVFPLARTSFVFAGGPTLVSVLNRTCTATG